MSVKTASDAAKIALPGAFVSIRQHTSAYVHQTQRFRTASDAAKIALPGVFLRVV